MRAFGNDAIRRRDQHIDQPRLVQLPTPFKHAKAHALPGQGAVDEHGLAFHPGDTPPIVREVHDVRLLSLAELQVAGHAAANSFQCGAPESDSNFRTRATSTACSAAFK
jgi:hypothetical protein